jgi:hypothetical protein
LRQVQDFFPSVREFRNLSAKARSRPKGHYQTGPVISYDLAPAPAGQSRRVLQGQSPTPRREGGLR